MFLEGQTADTYAKATEINILVTRLQRRTSTIHMYILVNHQGNKYDPDIISLYNETTERKREEKMGPGYVDMVRPSLSELSKPSRSSRINRKLTALNSEVLHTAWKKLLAMTIIFQFGDVLGDLGISFGRFGRSLGGSWSICNLEKMSSYDYYR